MFLIFITFNLYAESKLKSAIGKIAVPMVSSTDAILLPIQI